MNARGILSTTEGGGGYLPWKGGGYLPWTGVEVPTLDGGTYLGQGVPTQRRYPPVSWKVGIPPHKLEARYPPLSWKVGTPPPHQLDGKYPPPSPVDWHTNLKYYLPYPSDASGVKMFPHHLLSYFCYFYKRPSMTIWKKFKPWNSNTNL